MLLHFFILFMIFLFYFVNIDFSSFACFKFSFRTIPLLTTLTAGFGSLLRVTFSYMYSFITKLNSSILSVTTCL